MYNTLSASLFHIHDANKKGNLLKNFFFIFLVVIMHERTSFAKSYNSNSLARHYLMKFENYYQKMKRMINRFILFISKTQKSIIYEKIKNNYRTKMTATTTCCNKKILLNPHTLFLFFLNMRLLSFPESLDLTVSLWCHHHYPVSHILPHQTAQTLHNENNIKKQHKTEETVSVLYYRKRKWLFNSMLNVSYVITQQSVDLMVKTNVIGMTLVIICMDY